MPDLLNKQAIVNLLIDSPLREPIKINLIDIVNNTTEPDLPKVFPTITKELEIFQKATERRMKLAEETIAKLSGVTPAAEPATSTPPVPPLAPPPMPPIPPIPQPPAPIAPQVTEPAGLTVPPLDLPPMPTAQPASPTTLPPLPPLPTMPVAPAMAELGTPTPTPQADEDALAEIQKELDSLKTSAAADSAAATAPITPQA